MPPEQTSSISRFKNLGQIKKRLSSLKFSHKLIILSLFLALLLTPFVVKKQYFPLFASTSDAATIMTTVYEDTLGTGWTTYLSGGSINTKSTKQVYSGSYSLAYTPANPGNFLGLDYTNFDTTPYTYYRFAAKAGKNGQHYFIQMYDSSQTALTKVMLANYGGDPTSSSWKVYQIPLTDLGAVGKQIIWIDMGFASGSSNIALYLDSIVFVSSTVAPTNTPIPTTSISATPTPTATPTPLPGITITPTPSIPYQVKTLVFTMFDSETQPWLSQESLPFDFSVPNAFSHVRCSVDGLCVTTTGEGKVNAAASAMAILRDPQFSFQHSYFLTAGIAGTSPTAGTLGFAAWARWVVDWDLGNHLDPSAVPNPYGYIPNTSTGTAVFHLNETLTQLAFNVTSSLTLQDSSSAIAARQLYGQGSQQPYVAMCDTIAGDDYWSGTQLSNEAQYITSQLTNNQGTYCTTEQEDTAVAAVLQRAGYLNRYLSLRTASNFDQPYSGQSMQSHLNDSSGRSIALYNQYLVGSTMAHYLLTHNSL